ncbi:MAG: ribonuclease III [Planctomycetes bacterium]|nr:ribonuclease III [Planctomycetota bacterium]
MPEGIEETDIEWRLRDCEQAIAYRFRDRELLKHCLTHSSVSKTRLESNERLEFLGDAVLGVVVCELLFRRFPDEPEGELTRIKSALVSRNTCARISLHLGLERFLLLGKGLRTSMSIPPSIIAAVFESLIAGVYLDGGFDAARDMVERLIAAELERFTDQDHMKNFKSLLQQVAQKTLNATPVYQLLDEKGPDHAKCFKVAAVINATVFSAAWGPNKKEAEQRAACNALSQLDGREIVHATD